jgi:hypothetical protein
MENKVTKSRFLSWYFADRDDVNQFVSRCIRMMALEGFVNISVEILFEECAYIPAYICEEQSDNCIDDYEPNVDVELIQG